MFSSIPYPDSDAELDLRGKGGPAARRPQLCFKKKKKTERERRRGNGGVALLDARVILDPPLLIYLYYKK